ncbi:MAG: hypothetical protein PHP07_10595 [Eubacteriales bacterium]|jgi:hypothetical protein|nr:hypothetical protein [Eubacteriales bacterium]MDD3573376.1 hypothetical protein [Eubacteriales bacterium]
MRIQITQGAYRYRPEGEKSAVVVRAGDPAFDLPDQEAARLVSLGVAQGAPPDAETAEIRALPADAGENPKAGQAPPDADPDPLEPRPAYSVKMTARQLRDLMDEYGVAFEDGMTKAHLVQRLDSFFDDYEEEGESGEGLPALNAEPPAL